MRLFQGRVARVVGTVAVVVGALLWVASWATASPIGATPDEDYHLASIWCPPGVEGACPTRRLPDGTREVELPRRLVDASACMARQPDASGACVERISLQPSWTPRVDDGEYPGGFYRAMHLFVGKRFTESVFTMRLVNGAVAVALLGAAVALTSPRGRLTVSAGLLLASVPMGVYLVASINPSGWAVTGVAAAWVGVHGYLAESSTGRRAGLAAVALAGALLAATARSDAGAYVALAALAVAVLHADRLRADARHAALPAVIAVVGVLGYVSGSQGVAVANGMDGRGPGGLGLLASNVFALPSLLLESMAGPLNWLDTSVPALTSVTVTLFAAAAVFWGLRSLTWAKGISLLGLVVAFCVLPLLLLQLSGANVGAEVQGRYLTPLVAVILMTALWDPVRNSAERLTRVQTTVVLLGLVAAQMAALWVQIRRFTTGMDGSGFNLDAHVEWWASPVPPMATVVLGSVGFAVVALGALLAGRRNGVEARMAAPLALSTAGILP
ncbi:MAG: DUF2142 domain-containing protein [Promicromonosporaceae bacterium]|nr:DUF2142 domain-containing protein [Promicromonosporaceae bacterium]